jgi:hypothetical protein
MGYATCMIQWPQLSLGLLTGVAAIVFGSVPGLPQATTDGFMRLADAFQAQLFGVPMRPHSSASMDQPRGFVLFGLAMITMTLLAYLAG